MANTAELCTKCVATSCIRSKHHKEMFVINTQYDVVLLKTHAATRCQQQQQQLHRLVSIPARSAHTRISATVSHQLKSSVYGTWHTIPLVRCCGVNAVAMRVCVVPFRTRPYEALLRHPALNMVSRLCPYDDFETRQDDATTRWNTNARSTGSCGYQHLVLATLAPAGEYLAIESSCKTFAIADASL